MPPIDDRPTLRRASDGLMLGSAVLVVVLTAVRAGVFWRSEAYLDDASGNWTALAKDFASGVLYRPLQGPAGYGGSRYFPLHFVLHAGLMRFMDPVSSGFLLSAAALALLAGGVYLLVRRLGGSVILAASCGAFALVAHPSQEALLTIKGDGLAAALNVWGVALVAGGAAGAAPLLAAAACFTLAFAAKITAVSGVAAAVLWFWTTGRRRPAVALALATAGGMALVLAFIAIGSHGVAINVLGASASGGATVSDILQAPFTLARQARRVPETLVFIQLGCAALLVLLFQPRPHTNLAAIFFVCVLAVTTVIFASPGTDTNHFLDLHAASIVLVAAWLVTRGLPAVDVGAAALIVAALAASLSLVSGLVHARTEQKRGVIADALRLIPDKTKPILAQNPLVPVEAGQRAYLIDPFLIRVITERQPALAEPLWADFRRQRFGAVVLELDPSSDRAQTLYRTALLGERFLDEMNRYYEPAGHVGTRTIFLPRPEPAGARP
jgi:hypothetical protein